MEIIRDIIKEGSVNRPKVANSCKFITIHETANTKKGANAAAHAKYIKSLKERTSWHYSVDDSSIYQHLPDEEKSYHTSKAEANENAIAIELCVNSDGDFEKTLTNAVWLVQLLRKKHSISAENITTHFDWTGKNCPATLLKSGWDEFFKRCAEDEEEKGRYITVAQLREMGYCGVVL